MEVIKRTVLILGALIFSIKSFSQNNDSIPKDKGESLSSAQQITTVAAQKFAIARPLNIEFTNSLPYDISLNNGDKSLPEGKVQRFSQAKISSNINILKKKTWLLGATIGYNYTSIKTDMFILFPEGAGKVDGDFHYLYASANVAYFSTLFNKRTIYSSSIIFDGSEKHIERVKGVLTGTMVLKANKSTKMSVGIAVNLDPLSEVPVLPIFTYEHKLRNGFIIDIVLPKNMYLRKYVFNNARISLGAEMNSPTFYLYNIDGTDQKYQYRQLDVNPGFVYEHCVGKHFLFTAKTGMKFTPSSRLFKKEESLHNPEYKFSPDPTFYFNVGVSFNPSSLIGTKK